MTRSSIQKMMIIAVFFFCPATFSIASENASVDADTLQQHAETFQFSSKQKQALALKLAKDLRCPQCQNQNLIESNSPVAEDLRLKVYEKVEAGEHEQQIIEYMKQRFGDMVHYQPPVKPSTSILWIAPIVIFLMFTWMIVRKVRPKSVL